MKISIDPVISSRIKVAWSKLTPAQRNQIAPFILEGNQQAIAVVQTGKAPAAQAVPAHHVLAFSALNDDHDDVLNSLEAGVVVTVGPDGVIWGTGKYQQFDPGWSEAFAVFLESLLPVVGGKHPFVTTPQTITIPDSVQIALAGDWGTGDWRGKSNPAPSTDVGLHMRTLQPHITLHLGDVYYAGTGGQEEHNLVNIWPQGSLASFTLNSNHEMYSGAKPYYEAISKPPFDQQKGCSYFALENNNWVIVALDSSYYADEGSLYMSGSLGPDDGPQIKFLQTQAAKHKKLMIITHHNGMLDQRDPVTGAVTTTSTSLWKQLMSALPSGSPPAYWYWGHVHAGVVYKPQGGNLLCRCCGHAALPWGQAIEFDPKNNGQVEWCETRSAHDPDIPQRILNGFAMLYLDGPDIKEVFYDENGGVAWP